MSADGPKQHERLWRPIAGDLRAAWRELVAYEVLFKLLAASLVTPLSAALVSWLISLSGEVALSNERIASFVFSPLGLLTIAFWSVVGFTIALAEQAGLLVIAAGAIAGRPLGALPAMWFGLRRTLDFARLAALEIGVSAAVVLPLAGVAAAAYVTLLGDHDINFYLAQRPPSFVAAVAIGALLAAVGGGALCWLQLRWLFALPSLILDGRRARAALAESWRLTRGRFWRNAKVLLVWLACTAALGVIVAALLSGLTAVATAWAGERLSMLLPTLAVLAAMHVLAAALVSFLSITTYSLLIARLYRRACQENDSTFARDLASDKSRALPATRFLTKRRFAFAIAIAFLVVTTLSAWGMLEMTDADESFAITAHRGSSLRAPENTLAAVELAIAEGADYIEIDVQETADGHVVMLHDKDFKRLAGDDRKIWETTLAELADIDVGSHFDPKFSDQRVPLLADVINTARGKVKLNIELKYNGHDEQLAARVVEIIRREKFERQCAISSLNQDALKEVRRLAPELKTGLITAASIGNLSKVDADFLSVSRDKVTQELIDAAHRRDKEVHVWTVNDVKNANRLIDMGVDNLLTDDPQRMVQLRRERAELSTAQRLLLQSRRWFGG